MFVDVEYLPQVDIFRRGLDALIDDTDLVSDCIMQHVLMNNAFQKANPRNV